MKQQPTCPFCFAPLETLNPSPRSNEYKKDDQVGMMNTMLIIILIAIISLLIILVAAGLVFFYLREHCTRFVYILRVFLGFKFLMRNEEKIGIPLEEQGIFEEIL